MSTRGIRGAIVSLSNNQADILAATRTLTLSIIEANPGLHPEDVASIFFTVTHDLNGAFPALAVRQIGWVKVPILCAQEIPVPEKSWNVYSGSYSLEYGSCAKRNQPCLSG